MAFDAHDHPISDLFAKTTFDIPRNQRRYVWKKDNWNELLEDIVISTSEGANPHFIGSVVLEDNGKVNGISSFTIIDGQQRITTLTLILMAIMKLFSEMKMQNDFLGTIDYIQPKNTRNQPVCILQSDFHLSLTKLINAVVALEDGETISITSFVETNTLSKSKDKIIGEALKFFYFGLKQILESAVSPEETLIAIRNGVLDISLVSIVCSSEDSYTIFEILNARGQELESYELLKNYIMRYIQPVQRRDEAKAKWEDMESTLGASMKKFVSHYVTHRFGRTKEEKDSDYRIIQKKMKGSDIGAFFDDLKLKSEYYLRLIDPQKDGERKNCNSDEYRVFNFFKSKKLEQFRPIVLSLIHQKECGNLAEELYNLTIKYICNFFICYIIIGEERSNSLSDIVHKYAPILELDSSKEKVEDFATALKNKIPSIDWFKNAFNNLGWSNHTGMFKGEKNKNRVQITLELIEKYISQRDIIDVFTIEHILPDSEGELNAHIGNLIPLEEPLNRRSDTRPLQEKYTFYRESNFKTARGIAERYKDKPFVPKDRTDYLATLVFNNILVLNQFDFSNDI